MVILVMGQSLVLENQHSHPRDRAPFGQHQESRPLARSNFPRMRSVIVSYSQPIRFVRLEPEHSQSDGKSVNRGLLVLDPPGGGDSW